MKSYTSFPTPLPPLYDENAALLILGSFPSVKSLDRACYYGHTSNRFWKILYKAFDTPFQTEPENRKAFALAHRIALTDTLVSCFRHNSADDFESVEPNEKVILQILKDCRIKKIITNGKAADTFFKKYLLPKIPSGIVYVNLPSTSSRNVIDFDTLYNVWIKELLN